MRHAAALARLLYLFALIAVDVGDHLCPPVSVALCKSIEKLLVNSSLIDFAAIMLHPHLRYPGNCKSYRIVDCPVDAEEVLLQPPVISVWFKNEPVHISLTDHSHAAAAQTFSALAEKLRWTSMAVIGDRSDGFKFDENSSVDLVVPATPLMPDDQLDRLADLIVRNHDAAFVMCTTVSCYNFFLKIFHRTYQTTNFSFLMNEDTTQKMTFDMPDWPIDTEANVLGLRKSRHQHDQDVVKRLRARIEQVCGCSRLSDISCFLLREDQLEKVLALHAIMDFLVSNTEKETKAFVDRNPSRLSANKVRFQAAYDILKFRLRAFQKIGFARDSQVTLSHEHTVVQKEEDQATERRRRRAVPCSPAARSNDNPSQLHFRVTTVVEWPFLMYDPNNTFPRGEHTENNLTGLIVELTNALAKKLDFTYTMTLAQDGKYGDVENDDPDSAKGMIGEIIRCEKDLSISAIAITASRAAHVAFTKPWMDYGLALYRRKPTPAEPKLFAFLDPFETTLWLVILACLVSVALLMVTLHHISPFSSQSRPVGGDRGVYSQNLFTSAWLLYVTAVQQEPDYVGFLSGKVLLLGWFFFALIAISTYTANLAAFLTVQRIPEGIASVDDLSHQTEIPYGTVRDTAVETFFKRSPIETYERMGDYMTATPESMVNTTEMAIERVRSDSGYVFVWDSPILEFFASQRPCTTEVIGRTFNHKGYGIVMPFDAPYLDNFSIAVLEMRDNGVISQLARKWLDSSECASSVTTVTGDDAGQVSIKHMYGVILLLGASSAVALLIAVVERWVWHQKRRRTVGADDPSTI